MVRPKVPVRDLTRLVDIGHSQKICQAGRGLGANPQAAKNISQFPEKKRVHANDFWKVIEQIGIPILRQARIEDLVHGIGQRGDHQVAFSFGIQHRTRQANRRGGLQM